MRFVILFISLLPQDKVTLEWKFKKGDTFRYESSQASSMDFSGTEMKQETLMGLVLEVTQVGDDGVATFKATYDRVKFVASGMMESDYDSDRDKNAPDDMMGKMMAAFVGQSFTMKMNPRGDVLEVKGFAEIMEKMFKDSDEEGDMMKEMMKQMYSDENMKSMIQMMFAPLPKKGVAKGDAWDSEGGFPVPMMGKLALKTKSTLKELRDEGREAVIDEETKMEVKEGDEGEGMARITDASAKREVVWLVEQGRMKSAKGTMKMTFSASGQEFTSNMDMEMKLAPKEKKKSDE